MYHPGNVSTSYNFLYGVKWTGNQPKDYFLLELDVLKCTKVIKRVLKVNKISVKGTVSHQTIKI